jgi:hypothetical protein
MSKLKMDMLPSANLVGTRAVIPQRNARSLYGLRQDGENWYLRGLWDLEIGPYSLSDAIRIYDDLDQQT